MNKSIRYAAIFSILLTVVLLINITIIMAFKEEEYAQNPLNARGFHEAQQVPRGNISANGALLAESYKTEEGTYQRTYPNYSSSLGPVVGYLSPQYGTSGLEAGFNGVLSGTDSSVSANRVLSFLSQETHGANIELTVDPDLQQQAYQRLVAGGYTGAVVALRPSTGAILAMASSPSYDPNLLVNPSSEETAWNSLNNDPSQPLVSQASQVTLPPGSIFKIITTAAALRNGYSPDSQVTGAAEITLPGTDNQLSNYGDQSCNGSETVTLKTAFQYSCNTAFVQVATEIGDQPLREAAAAFGVGESHDLGLQNAAGTLGELPDLAAVGQSAIGQRDVTMTALQAAIMAGTIANGGVRMEPYIVNRVTRPDMSVISQTKPKQSTKAIESSEASTIENLMYASEQHTRGYDGNGFASKTGTAEHAAGEAPHVWYVAFDPAKDVAVAVMVQNGGGQGMNATGGSVAAPIGRSILYAAPAGGGQ